MDIISHALYGGVVFGRKNYRDYLMAFLIGLSPDLFSFGIFSLARLMGFEKEVDFSKGHLDASLIPQYVDVLYNFTHSLVIFALVFLGVWFFRKKPYWPLGAWVLHILIDIPSHSFAFFPTPFLWPVSDFKIDGIGWGNPIIFFPNVAILVILYAFFWYKKRKKSKS
jgi:hypothetical protein